MRFVDMGNWYKILFSEAEFDYVLVNAESPDQALKNAKVREPYLRIEKLDLG